MEIFVLVIPAFIAGILTFFAPCTLPLVPGYLAFISGTVSDRKKIFFNGLLYVIGFSSVFIILGSLVSLGGTIFFQYRGILTQIGGVFVILFGIFLLSPNIPIFRFLLPERHLGFAKNLRPGNASSSLLFGGFFAFGWSPCVGPILGTILTLAAFSGTVAQGAFLLFIFSLGLAIPFLLTALFIGWTTEHLSRVGRVLPAISMIGGFFLIILGMFMVTDNFSVWIGYAYRFFNFLKYDAILDYL